MIITKKGTVVISDDDAKCEIRDFHFDCAVGPETTGYILAVMIIISTVSMPHPMIIMTERSIVVI